MVSRPSTFPRICKLNHHDSYTKALDCSPTEEEAHTLRINRSQCFLKTKKFDAALSDLESTTIPEPDEKLLFRKAQALYNLQKYRECCEVLKDLCLKYPHNVEAKSELTRAIKRLVEQETGKYQFKDFYIEAELLPSPHLDRSTYIGPVSIRASGSRGRGLFTTKAVKAGDLLLCEKAFAYAFVDTKKAENIKNCTVLINVETDSITLGTHAELIRLIVQRLWRNHSLASLFTSLHHGSYKSVDVSRIDDAPVVDT